MNAPSAKLKTPEKLEVPMTKVQRSSNFQIPNSGERGSFDGWNLGFGIYLEFGTWDLELYLPLFFEDTTEITKNYEHHSTNSLPYRLVRRSATRYRENRRCLRIRPDNRKRVSSERGRKAGRAG